MCIRDRDVTSPLYAFTRFVFVDVASLKRYVLLAILLMVDVYKRQVYDRNFKVFKNLYKCNKENFAILNG